MIKATREDKSLVVTLLKDSFANNQSVNYIIKQDRYRERRIISLMEYSFEMCFLFGEVWLSDDRRGAALILYPQRKHMTLSSVWLDIKLISRAIGISGSIKALKREAWVKAKRPREHMAYLWFIGVDPYAQHCGIGSQLLGEIITSSEAMHLPIYLETSVLKNLPWYERFNFHRYDLLEFDYMLYFFKREPDK